MKRILIVLAVLAMVSPAVAYSNDASDDLSGTYDDTAWFDGG